MELNPSESPMITLDKYSRVPIYEQVVEQFEKLILSGTLAADAPLPSVRSLSLQLSINPNTLQKAFSELERLQLSYTVAGNGRFVHPDARELLCRSRSKTLYDDLEALLSDLLALGEGRAQIEQKVTEFLQKHADKQATTEQTDPQ